MWAVRIMEGIGAPVARGYDWIPQNLSNVGNASGSDTFWKLPSGPKERQKPKSKIQRQLKESSETQRKCRAIQIKDRRNSCTVIVSDIIILI